MHLKLTEISKHWPEAKEGGAKRGIAKRAPAIYIGKLLCKPVAFLAAAWVVIALGSWPTCSLRPEVSLCGEEPGS